MQTKSTKFAVLYSQNNCQACNTALSLLSSHGYVVDVLKLEEVGKAELLKHFPDARSVPQIIADNLPIGGLAELKVYLGVK